MTETPIPKTLDAEASRELAEQLNGKRKNCFENAFQAVLKIKEASYVQGFLLITTQPRNPREHSWIEVGDRILDPNLPSLNSKAENLFYFPAQRLSASKVKAAVEEAKEDYPDDPPLPVYGKAPYEYYGDLMLGGKEYQAAFEAATAKGQEVIQAQES